MDTQLYNHLSEQIRLNKFSHATLLTSSDEVSLKIFSKLVAMTLCCENVCFNCENCVKILSNTHPDVLFYPTGKTFMVQDALDIIENAYKKPTISEKKIFVISNLDSSIISQNKLLKILEEPPKNVYFILCANNSKSILETILSRTQSFMLPPFQTEKLKQIISSHNLSIDERIIFYAEGELGKALSSNKKFLENYESIENMLRNLNSSKDISKYVHIFSSKDDFAEKLELLSYFFRQMLYKKTNQPYYVDFDQDFSLTAIQKIQSRIISAQKKLKSNVNINLICDNLLIGILEEKYLWK